MTNHLQTGQCCLSLLIPLSEGVLLFGAKVLLNFELVDDDDPYMCGFL